MSAISEEHSLVQELNFLNKSHQFPGSPALFYNFFPKGQDNHQDYWTSYAWLGLGLEFRDFQT
jgi:hypothetical protein